VDDLTDPEVAIVLGERMAVRTADGTMPPLVADPDCHDYIGSERISMPDSAISVLAEWAAVPVDKRKVGKVEDRVAVPELKYELQEYDMEVRFPTAYNPPFNDAANPGNEYRCFALEHGRDETFWITAMSPVVDAHELVHHIVTYKIKADTLPANYDPNLGANCIENASTGDGMLSGWAPGAFPIEFDPGYGVRVDPDDLIVVQMHYYDNGTQEDVADQSGFRFRTTTEAPIEVYMLPLGPLGFQIPPNTFDHEIQDSLTLPANALPYQVTIHGTFPHMHWAGKSYKAWIEYGPDSPNSGEEECVVASKPEGAVPEGEPLPNMWDFDNQLTYMFDEPIVVSAGDKLTMKCSFDNPNTSPIVNGERTDEEMCFAFTFASVSF